MKFSYLRAIAALAMALTLAACGGKASFAVQGQLTDTANPPHLVPLTNPGLVLQNNGGDNLSIPVGATTFVFPHQLDYGNDFNITVLTQPDHMTCGIANGSGSAGHTIAISAAVICTQNSWGLSGQITGLTVDSLTLINGTGGGQIVVTPPADGSGSTDFALPVVFDGQAYGVTVLTQPAGLTCTVTNGVGIMHTTAVSNLLVSCKPVTSAQ